MKYNKKTGSVKLEPLEIRVGNFFVKLEDHHVKIQDLNSVFSFRANRRMAIGIWLENMWGRARMEDESAVNTLKTYIATMWSLFSVVPDDEYVSDALGMAESALNRHPEWYGIKKDATPEEDADAADEVRGMKQFEEDIRHIPDGEVSKDES